jgi:parallel beta-helix repeat protein
MESDLPLLAGRWLPVLCLSLLSGLLPVTPAAAGTIWSVANRGVDTASCGTRLKPCRSISTALEKSSDGDVIEVGAGLYGDLNGDGAFTAPGEEHYGTSRSGQTCIICVTKAVQIVSLHGADATIIDAGNSRRPDPNSDEGQVHDVVNITASNVTFGGDGRGFTVTGGAFGGVEVGFLGSNIRVIGNTARGNGGTGFDVTVPDETSPPFPVPKREYLFENNTAVDNGVGFGSAHDEDHQVPERVIFTGNVASGNSSAGFSLSGIGYPLTMIGNVTSHNGVGIAINGAYYEIRSNSVLGNTGPGIIIIAARFGFGMYITGNTIAGNTGAGVLLLPDADNNTIRGNNIYGNFGAVPVPIGPQLGSTLNCGIVSDGGREVGSPVSNDATNNYWGSPNGPGLDPADNAGKGCDFNHATTVVKPFAKDLFDIVP